MRWNPETAKLSVVYEDPKTGKFRSKKINPQHDLAPDLNDRPAAELDRLTVDFSWRKGSPTDVRPRNAPATPRAAPTKQPDGLRVDPDRFVNPYTFLPTLARPGQGPLADAVPTGHDRLHEDLWTGTLRVRLTVATPLLLLDPARAKPPEGTNKDHLVYPVLSHDGRPHLPATSVKGMLRAAYEAVTNSRLGVFNGHDQRLAHRMASADSQHMVPARVSDGGRHIILLSGDTPVGQQSERNPLLHAAWLPRYYPSGRDNVTYTGTPGKIPQHGDRVVAMVRRREHRKGFSYWQVENITLADEAGLPQEPLIAGPGRSHDTGEVKQIHGWVCSTNRNIGNKHDERVFFAGDIDPDEHDLTEDLRQQWRDTITNYRTVHRPADIQQRPHPTRRGEYAAPDEYLGREPGSTAWSRHLYEAGATELTAGTLCYAHVDKRGRIRSLQPVTIGRSLFDKAPAGLLSPGLRPASRLDELSPADRVFGWVAPDGAPAGQGAHRGQLRIGPVTPGDDAGFEDFGEEGFPLAILGQPKPQQGRFYLANGPGHPTGRSDHGNPLPAGVPKADWFSSGQSLRGRKTYWHHRGLPQSYWTEPTANRTQTPDESGRFQEYRRPDLPNDKHLDNQNRSVRGWVRPGSSFTFAVDVTNLSDVELGALVWLLQLPDEHYHRLGLGKPLGFGSVRLELDTDASTDLRAGGEWAETYRSLSPNADNPAPNVHERLDRVRQLFQEAVATTNPPAETSPLNTFLKAARGLDQVAVHYPRARPEDTAEGEPVAPDPEGRNYVWFTKNEQIRDRRVRNDRGRSLPAVWSEEPGLPYHPEKSDQETKGSRRPR
ncbi:TIGR03986 family CRISPR-associated RAMP protein [Streptomyces sp. TS71-3]|uniref:TIGR03986 family type III CRISPR-associated RAMP protein n=1 Tax=Streptomyces sp. TS71-3 TaxID=2733862 RepID=UPI001BB41CAF|nr:TIGR03986 family CRISPR-associated RAMP protein [Streptomyces sp. TS71-3]